jgi:hypothetical protein
MPKIDGFCLFLRAHPVEKAMHNSKPRACQENYLPVGILSHFDIQNARGQKSDVRRQLLVDG